MPSKRMTSVSAGQSIVQHARAQRYFSAAGTGSLFSEPKFKSVLPVSDFVTEYSAIGAGVAANQEIIFELKQVENSVLKEIAVEYTLPALDSANVTNYLNMAYLEHANVHAFSELRIEVSGLVIKRLISRDVAADRQTYMHENDEDWQEGETNMRGSWSQRHAWSLTDTNCVWIPNIEWNERRFAIPSSFCRNRQVRVILTARKLSDMIDRKDATLDATDISEIDSNMTFTTCKLRCTYSQTLNADLERVNQPYKLEFPYYARYSWSEAVPSGDILTEKQLPFRGLVSALRVTVLTTDSGSPDLTFQKTATELYQNEKNREHFAAIDYIDLKNAQGNKRFNQLTHLQMKNKVMKDAFGRVIYSDVYWLPLSAANLEDPHMYSGGESLDHTDYYITIKMKDGMNSAGLNITAYVDALSWNTLSLPQGGEGRVTLDFQIP